MPNHVTPPFFQLGRYVALCLPRGHDVETVEGEVMDTDDGWLAVKADDTGQVAWYNLAYVASIRMLGRVEHP